MYLQQAYVMKPPLGVQLNRSHPLAKGLVGCWLFNEGGGGYIYDASGNRNTGTLTNMASPPTATSGWGVGKFGSAIRFEGTDDYINCGNDSSLDITDAITIEAWVKPDNIDGYRVIIGNGATNWKEGYVLYLRATADEMLRLGINTGTQLKYATAGNIAVDTWSYVVSTFDGTSIYLYINGIKYSPALTVNDQAVNVGDTVIGKNVGLLGDFNGSIDVARIYNRAKSASEVQQLYREPFCMFEPAYEWGMLYAPSYIPYPLLSGMGGGIGEAMTGGIAR